MFPLPESENKRNWIGLHIIQYTKHFKVEQVTRLRERENFVELEAKTRRTASIDMGGKKTDKTIVCDIQIYFEFVQISKMKENSQWLSRWYLLLVSHSRRLMEFRVLFRVYIM